MNPRNKLYDQAEARETGSIGIQLPPGVSSLNPKNLFRQPAGALVSKRRAFAIGALIAIVLGIAAGYRQFGHGHDFDQYESFYDELRGDASDVFRFETGFVLSAIVSKFILRMDYMAFAAMLMTMSLLIKFWTFGRLHRPLLTMLFYIANWYPLHEYTQVRGAFAISLLFLSMEYLQQKRWIVFLGLAFLATTFHSSVILAAGIMALAHFISGYRLFVGFLIILAAVAAVPKILIWGLSFLVQLNPLLESYMNAMETGLVEAPNIFSGVNILSALFLVLVAVSGTLTDRRRRTLFLISCAGLAVFIGFADIPTLAHRLKELLLVFMTMLAFEYRTTSRTLPQAIVATGLCGWTFYRSLLEGLFADY